VSLLLNIASRQTTCFGFKLIFIYSLFVIAPCRHDINMAFVNYINQVGCFLGYMHRPKVMHVVPTYKAGSRLDPGNYRGICISSCLGKFFALILNSRFNTFFGGKQDFK
jgi:hypothetical protein